MKTPIAIFAYNRPHHLELALSSLERCTRFEECELFIFCDGPKTTENVAGVESTRRVAFTWASRCGAHVVVQDRNFGLGRSIVTGVSELVSSFGRIIVIEDDLVVRADYLDYMLLSLERYKDCPKVYQVSGYMFPVMHPPKPHAFFLPMTTSWGWATWDRAWSVFNWNPVDTDSLMADPALRHRFDLDGTYPYSRMLERRVAGEIDSWAILWLWAVFRAGGLVLYPCRTMVWVGGFDGTGTHNGNDHWRGQRGFSNFDQSVFAAGICLPDSIEEDVEALARIKYHLRQWNPKTFSFRVLRLRQVLGLTKSRRI